MKVDIDADTMSEIVRTDLNHVVKDLQNDLKRRKTGGTLAIFHMDAKADIAELEKHIEAFKLVLRYYGAN